MTPNQASDAVIAARAALIEYRRIRDLLPDTIRVAYRIGISKNEIHKLTGLARSTVDRYLGHRI